jgi:hypothetical protein
VIDIVIGAAMVRILPGFDAVALTTVLRAHENGDAIAVRAGIRFSNRRSTTAVFG